MQTIYQSSAEQLRQARSSLWGDVDPHRAQFLRLKKALKSVGNWVNTLSYEQLKTMANVRFFLWRSLSPLSRSGHYETMIAGTWDAGDFDTLRYAGRSLNEEASILVDYGVLKRTGGQVSISMRLQTQAIVARRLEPGFVQAVEVHLGQREPLDFD